MNTPITLWRTDASPVRYFLLPDDDVIAPGTVRLHGPGGCLRHLDEASLLPYELGEPAALRWAQAELDTTLDALMDGIDERLDAWRAALARQRGAVRPETRLTPDAAPALLALLRRLPGVVVASLASTPGDIAAARADMEALQRRLKQAGIDLDARFTGFPERLAGLRDEFERARKHGGTPPEQP